ncbi:unnamed protein product [Adineta ricciae]|uniref:Insulin-like domain-containing protein n=1 Tax=Adineta ricciae TaxID=249248 RepID=A0A815J3C3_ADIRI|nr:unnamed protein product [Adineta ricciae]CAF1376574.1 unnamed protein product [Adineta ricciae]
MAILFYAQYILIILILCYQGVYCESSGTSVPVIHDNCTVEYDGNLLTEGQTIEMKSKLYKVEDCGIHRAYHACGVYLLQMVSIACDILRRDVRSLPATKRVRRSVRRKLLTEACCETLCTVAEMTRYCPRH